MKTTILICLFALMAFTACKKANSNNQSPTITGQWYDVKDIYTVTDKNGVTTTVDTQSFNHTDKVLFNSNGSGTGADAYFTSNFSYKVTSNNLQFTQTMYIDSMNVQVPYKSTWNVPIKKLTSNSLELYFVIGPDQSDGHSENHDVSYSK